MAEYFAEGHLRFVNGEWRDDNGNAIEIFRVRHGRWKWFEDWLPSTPEYPAECLDCRWENWKRSNAEKMQHIKTNF